MKGVCPARDRQPGRNHPNAVRSSPTWPESMLLNQAHLLNSFPYKLTKRDPNTQLFPLHIFYD